MQLIAQRDTLLEELLFLSSVIQKKPTSPVLANILFRSIDLQTVEMTCSDGFSTLRTQLPAQSDEIGQFCISSVKLLDVVRSLDDGEIRMKTQDNNRVQIKAGKATINIPGISHALYPPVKDAVADGILIPAEILENLVNRTSFVIPTSLTHSKFTLNGANLVFTPSKIAAVALDGNRLAYAEGVLLSNEVTTNILIPKESLGDVLKLTKKSPGEEIILVCDQNLLTFKSELRVLTCRRLHGSFPNYVMMFPQGATVKADCNASLLRRSLTRASNLASEETRGIILTFRPEEIEIQTQGDYGDINETIYANYDGEPMAIGFNSKYLLDFLREGVEDEHDRILFNITSPLKPIELGSQALEGYRYVVTPRNIPGANQSVAEKEVTAVQG